MQGSGRTRVVQGEQVGAGKKADYIQKNKVEHFLTLYQRLVKVYGSSDRVLTELHVSSSMLTDMRRDVLTSGHAERILTLYREKVSADA